VRLLQMENGCTFGEGDTEACSAESGSHSAISLSCATTVKGVKIANAQQRTGIDVSAAESAKGAVRAARCP
jgi:hypothetical protein